MRDFPGPRSSPGLRASEGSRRGPSKTRLISPLTRRILAVNLLALVILVGGLLYLDRYKQGLIAAELEALRTQAEMFAAAIGEGAVVEGGVGQFELAREPSVQMVRRLAEPAGVRARLYDLSGSLLADSRMLLGAAVIQIEDLPPPDKDAKAGFFRRLYDTATSWLASDGVLPPYPEQPSRSSIEYPEVARALAGDPGSILRNDPRRGMIFSVAVPVQRYKQVVGAVMLSRAGTDIVENLYHVRLNIIRVFGFAFAVTVLLSLYLAGTLARPIRRLAAAADLVRSGHGRRHVIPDFSRRGDEIGDLSGALRDMTEALWRRMDAVEAFAADVAHEIKNPLTSLHSAVETVVRVRDPEQQKKLLAIVQDDVERLNRLISDISDASRLDAELSRTETEPVQMRSLLETLAEVYRSTGVGDGVAFSVEGDPSDALEVSGMEGRLVQVFRNLIANAVSFSPPGGTIRLRGDRDAGFVRIAVEDDGPGIPDNMLAAIFERFYSERPKSEKFGTHSGLGLSISTQIVEAHGGTIRAENRRQADGTPSGARFIVRLPARPTTGRGR